MPTTDPLTKVYEALWDLLERGVDFRNLVHKGNRIKLCTKDESPFKENLLSNDVPEVVLMPAPSTSTSTHHNRTTSGSSIKQGFQIRVATGQQNLHEVVFPLKWAIYKAMADWRTVLSALTWKSQTYVIHAKLADASEGISQADVNRGIVGWTILWQCDVEMWFATKTLIAEA